MILAIANQKGGVGKTTTAVNTSAILSRRGLRLLLVDMDPQGNATSSFGIDKRALDSTVYDILVRDVTAADLIIPAVRPGLDLLPANPSLAGAEVELVDLDERSYRLRDAIDTVAGRYDLIIIDCPPSLGLLTVNALSAATRVVVPIQCEYLALEGLGQLIATIDLVKRSLNPDLDVAGVLMTMYDARTRLSAHVVEEVRRFFPRRMFQTIVPRSVRLAEAPSYGQSIDEYDAGSRGAAAYELFAAELLERLGIEQPTLAHLAGNTEAGDLHLQ
ncbi:MAG: ParA family protein [Thermomicrobiales bacterium]|nr:ParA family protein [Thermomicrobiales bacterium]